MSLESFYNRTNTGELWRSTLAVRYLPNDPNPIFHAKDIFHGVGKFKREEWPRERRAHLLSELCEIPRMFELPVIAGFTERKRYEEKVLKTAPSIDQSKLRSFTHAETFLKAAMAIEGWMSRVTQNESAMIIAEDAPKIKNILKIIHTGYTDRLAELGQKNKMFHSNHIIETVHFAAKLESMPLQVADTCAFILKRHFMDKHDSASFFDILRPQLVWYEQGRVAGTPYN